MPKLKTRKGVKKRFKITGTGKILKHKAFHGHLLSKKSKKRKRALRRPDVAEGKRTYTHIQKNLPWG